MNSVAYQGISDLEPGTYVIAVSGGVDSMALLDLMVEFANNSPAISGNTSYRLVVAHFDHGIRGDSGLDRQLVQTVARQHRLPFVYDRGLLGPDTSEAKARHARYQFLHKIRNTTGARAIITAHHKDDVLETAILHLLRGSGRKGLGSMLSTDVVKRPLLNIPKNDLIKHAKEHNLLWHDDISNQDTRYLRNHIRHNIIPNLTPDQLETLLKLIDQLGKINKEIDAILDLQLHLQPSVKSLNRQWFIGLSHQVALEIMAHWLRRHNIRSFDSKLLEKLVIAAKTLAPGQYIDVDKAHRLTIGKTILALNGLER